MRVGIVDYINALPFTHLFLKRRDTLGHVFYFAPPTQLNILLKERGLDIALTSSAEYLDGSYQILPDFCIASHTHILSVNFYTRRPLNTLSGAKIGLTSDSSTSISLLKVLCHHLWKVKPKYLPLSRSMLAAYDAFLLIGNEALEHPSFFGYTTIDLAAAWFEMTRLPFVFALFTAQKEVNSTLFQQNLHEALAYSEGHREKLIEEAKKQCPLSRQLIYNYYQACHYRLGDKEREGLQTFQQLRKHVS